MTDQKESNTEAKSEEVPPLAPEAAPSTVLRNLVVLPPRQREGISDQVPQDAIGLPPIQTEEPVASIRQALSDVCGYAHMTNFRFELEEPPEPKPSANHQRPTVSPYTGRDAVVSVPVAVKSLAQEALVHEPTNALDDYGNLGSMLPQGLKDGSGIRIVLERYDASLVKDHIARLKSLFDGNAPSTITLDDSATSSANPSPDASTDEESKSEDPKNGDNEQKETKASKVQPKPTPILPSNSSAAPDLTKLKDFFYLVCGEDPQMYSKDATSPVNSQKKESGSAKSKKKNKKNKEKATQKPEEGVQDQPEIPSEQFVRETIPVLNELEEKARVRCSVTFSGFHPPPPTRKLVGDLAYLEVLPPGATESIHITAIPTGFYVNNSSSVTGKTEFDPSPASKPCFSHELLDCLLQCSDSIRTSWEEALAASKTRSTLTSRMNEDGAFQSLFRVAIRGDFDGYTSPATASATEGIDALIQTPSWLVPVPSVGSEKEDAWTRNNAHAYLPARTEDALANNFGIDIHTGALRDWNEELQVAREMPTSSLLERVDRARVMYKVLNDFGEAAVRGVKAICEGQIGPMNPNEPTRSQVYLHNNIFFSRAVDAGVETFKVAKGDRAAKKSASRDVHCLGSLHRMERAGLYTLATVLIDYLGTRYVCQSILPGILSGEKTHTLLYGAVEAGSPLMWDEEMHELLEDTLGKSLMIATRPVPRDPLSAERLEEIEKAKAASPFHVARTEEEEKDDSEPTINVCAPIEAKGIRGSDQRKYVLDMTRLTPRDANWIPESEGGTGVWEAARAAGGRNSDKVPADVQDDEWTLAVLRPELITHYTEIMMAKYFKEKQEKEEKLSSGKTETKAADDAEKADGDKKPEDTKDKEDKEPPGETEGENKDSEPKKKTMTEEDLEYLKSLRFNVNVFLPDIKSLESIDAAAHAQIVKDEEMARNAAKYLWDEVLPRITREIRDDSWHQVPHDGKGLTEFLHQYGVNCRYLGRLAALAQEQEEADKKNDEILKQSGRFERRMLSHYWLELLECEIVARASKHVLDAYLTEDGGTAAQSPAQTIASFLSALVSDGEETAAQTENRTSKSDSKDPDDEDFMALTLFESGGNGDAVPRVVRGRYDMWQDIEREVGRRFRYTLTLYNKPGKSSRALYPALLRRVCQRAGIRLAAKNYSLGGKCLSSTGGFGGQLMASYPISPLDIVDVVPLMKHSAAHGEGFVPCGLGPSMGLPPLHISLTDARAALEAAHVHHNGRALSRALDFAQEACSLYQRVTEVTAHPGVVRCLDLMARILFDAGEKVHAAANAVKGLGLAVQINGFDSQNLISTHLLVFQMLLDAGQLTQAVKHLRASIFLMELMAGPNHVGISNAYHRVGTVYHGAGDLVSALKFYQEAASRESADRLLEGMISKSTALVLAGLGEYKLAVETEKRTFKVFSALLGESHQLTLTSDAALKKYMESAVQHGSKMVQDLKKQQEEAAALAIANEIEAEEAAEEEKKKKNKNKKKKGKK